MPEETVITAQTSEENISQDGVAGAVGESAEENTTDVSFFDGGDDGKKEETPAPSPQTKEQNSEYARRRREAERKQELKELREQTILETLGGKNPYTGGEMKDSADVEEYLTMREIEKNGGDPVADFAKFHKEKVRTQAAKDKADSESEKRYKDDLANFKEKYPNVGIKDLEGDQAFLDYADGKIGRVPLAKIYEGYIKHFGDKRSAERDAEQRARDAAAQMVANKKASVGSLANANGGGEVFFTREQVNAMSIAECEKNYDKIVKSMSHW